MPGGGGGGDDVLLRSSPAPAGGAQQQGHPSSCFPLDVVAAIAARSDPATLVRCAATCRGARRRVADDPAFLGRLRLRDTDRFVLPLLRGHLTTGQTGYDDRLTMLDTAAADSTRFDRIRLPPAPDDVLLAGDGDGEAGGASGSIRPFQVLKANLVMSDHSICIVRVL